MKILLISCLVFAFFASHSQDISYNRKIVDTLSSPFFWGRGYTKEGMKKAAGFLADQFKNLGLKPLDGKSFFQDFSYPANTFPGNMEVEVNGIKLIPGVDFIVTPESKGTKTNGNLLQKDSTHFIDPNNRILISLEEKLTWSVEQQQADYTAVQIDKKRLTAHYDHLGGMGTATYFPGANDNASGVALLLSLAKYYSTHPQKYSMGFILFAGEEAGLVGSKFFTEHPIVPLKNIRFLTNTDLAGTGEDGITVVNATEFPREFAFMNKINDENKYLVKINPRGKASISDHYFFTEKGVPSFFFYTLGGIKAYHDVFDKASTLPLNEQADLFSLLIKFDEELMK